MAVPSKGSDPTFGKNRIIGHEFLKTWDNWAQGLGLSGGLCREYKIMIRLILMVKCYFRLCSPKALQLWTTYQLATVARMYYFVMTATSMYRFRSSVSNPSDLVGHFGKTV
ncbi:hypothetical protein TNCV_1933531 [Trichonephila clavipes]|nr:hypothetical protein TNCV_1933531 [Trichonephila clavipes]